MKCSICDRIVPVFYCGNICRECFKKTYPTSTARNSNTMGPYHADSTSDNCTPEDKLPPLTIIESWIRTFNWSDIVGEQIRVAHNTEDQLAIFYVIKEGGVYIIDIEGYYDKKRSENKNS